MSSETVPTEWRETRALALPSAGEPPGDAPFVACGKLSEALAMARDRCKRAIRDRYNEHHKFPYASADAILTTAHDAFEGTGLALVPRKQRLTTIGGGGSAVFAVDRLFVLSHASGEFTFIEVEGYPLPQTGRPLHQAYRAALTNTLADVLRDLLQIPRVDADEAPRPSPSGPKASASTPQPTAEEVQAIIREYAKRAEECDEIVPLQQVYSEVWRDKRLTYDQKAALTALIHEQKKRINDAAAAAAAKPAGHPDADPFESGEAELARQAAGGELFGQTDAERAERDRRQREQIAATK